MKVDKTTIKYFLIHTSVCGFFCFCFLGRWKIHFTRVLVRNIKNWIIPTGKHVNVLLQKISNHVNSSMHFLFLPLKFIRINTYSKIVQKICHHTMLKKYIYICSKWKANVLLFRKKKLFKSLFVHASIYPVLVTNKNCYIILQSCNYKKPFIHPCLVFVLFKFFCWGRGGFKMEFCNNLKLLRQEKEEGCDLTEKSEQKHLSYSYTCQSFITMSADIYCDKVTDSKLIPWATYIIYLCH